MTICRYGNVTVLVLVSIILFLAPALTVIRALADPNLRQPGIPRVAWRLHKELSPKLQRWAENRLKSGRAAELSTSDISGTEWPLFGAVFYLWATESLQDELAEEKETAPPNVYARA